MTDDVQRRLADIEKRLARLERAGDRPPVNVTVSTPWCSTCNRPTAQPCGLSGCDNAARSQRAQDFERFNRFNAPLPAEKPPMTWNYYTRDEAGNVHQISGQVSQWCDCGRDVCRAPDCPTHKKGGA